MPLPNASTVTKSEPVLPLPPSKVDKTKHREELLARVRTLRENTLINRGEIKGGRKSDKEYVWINQHESRQSFFRGLGYEVCTDPAIITDWKREDGTHRRGDLILFQVDKDLHEAYGYEAELRAIEGLEAPREQFEAFASRENIKTFKPEGKGE